jgi:hypothetical protein
VKEHPGGRWAFALLTVRERPASSGQGLRAGDEPFLSDSRCAAAEASMGEEKLIESRHLGRVRIGAA